MVPTFACCFTIFSILSGSTFFQEFKGFCVERIVLFAIAVIISLVGVALLYQRVPGEGQPSEVVTATSMSGDPSDKSGTRASSAPATALPAPGPVPSSTEAGAAGAMSSILSNQKSCPALASLSWLSAATEAAAVASEVHASPRPSGHKRTNSGGAAGAAPAGTTTRQKPTHRRTNSEPVSFESRAAAPVPAVSVTAV